MNQNLSQPTRVVNKKTWSCEERRDDLLRQLYNVTTTRGFAGGRLSYEEYAAYKHRNETTGKFAQAQYWGAELGVSDKTAQGYLRALELDGLITRRRFSRGARIKLTEAGWALARQLIADREAHEAARRSQSSQSPVTVRSVSGLSTPAPRPQPRPRVNRSHVQLTRDAQNEIDEVLGGLRAQAKISDWGRLAEQRRWRALEDAWTSQLDYRDEVTA